MSLRSSFSWLSLFRRGSASQVEPQASDEASANFFRAREPEEIEDEEESWTSDESADADAAATSSLKSGHQADLERDKLARHTQGTSQVETVITRTKKASKWLLGLSVGGAIMIFVIGLLSLPQVRELINLCPWIDLSDRGGESAHWPTYLLLFIPTTLMAVLSITLWVTGLRFAAQIYGGVANEGGNGDDASSDGMAECCKLFTEAMKQSNGGSP